MVDLAADGLCVIAAASTVNFALRTPAEQDALVAGFGRWLHSLTAPVQILIRAERIDLTAQVQDLHARAAALPDRGLTRLARDHAEFLAHLHADADLLSHQVLLVFRDPAAGTGHHADADITARVTAEHAVRGDHASNPLSATGLAELTDPDTDFDTDAGTPAGARGPRRPGRQERPGRRRGRRGTRAAAGAAALRAAHDRLVRRVTEAADLLAPVGITVTGLDAARAGAVLTAALNPGLPIAPSAATALPGEVITAIQPFSPFPRPTPVSAPSWAGLHDADDPADHPADDDAIEAANLAASRGRRSPR